MSKQKKVHEKDWVKEKDRHSALILVSKPSGEMLSGYFVGWATDEEGERLLLRLSVSPRKIVEIDIEECDGAFLGIPSKQE